MSSFVFPEPDGPDLRYGPALRWGVVGTGGIAGAFTDALHRHTTQKVVAVTSRTLERGEAFASAHGFERAFVDAHAMASSPDVDVVYVATPHSRHRDDALASITAGTPVLIEKPLGLTAAETESVRDASLEHGVFAAEAMWTRHLPQFRVVQSLVEAGALGDVRLAHADVGWKADPEDGGRMLDPALGGGALLDMGVYALWFAQFAIGYPLTLEARGTTRADGVDYDAAAVLTGAGGTLATAATTLRATTDGRASLLGEAGSLRFVDHFVFPARFALTVNGETTEWQDPSGLVGRDGLAHEAVAIAELVAAGAVESPLHSLADSIALARSMDQVREALTVV